MQHTLTQLVADNAFERLSIPPSATAAAIRRSIEDARLRASMGLKDFDEAILSNAEQALGHEPGRFEMRVFAAWAGDPELDQLGSAHDVALGRVRTAVAAPGPSTVWAALTAWLGLVKELRPEEALAKFVPDGVSLPQFWGAAAAEITKVGTLRIDARADAVLLERTAAEPWIDPTEVASVVSTSVVQSLDNLAREARDGQPNLSSTQANAWGDGFIAQADQALKCQGLLLAHASRIRGVQTLAEQLSASSKAASYAVGTALHNGGYFEQAERVVLAALRLQHPEADREEMLADLRVIRVVAARNRFSAAMNSRDFDAAAAALRQVADNSEDEEEQAQALNAIPRVAAAAAYQSRPALLRLWDRGRGWMIGGAVLAGLVLWGVISDAISGDSDGAGNDGTLDSANVGQCIATSGTTSVSFRVVPCSSANDGRVVRVREMSGTSYPGESSIRNYAESICPATADSYIYPSRASWGAGDREVLCIDD